MTTEVVKQEASLVGTGGMPDSSDYSIPYVSLVQASSDAVKERKAMAGVFLASDGEQYETMQIVPLHIQFTRDFYDNVNAKAICGSSDRVVGRPRDLKFFHEHNVEVAAGDTLNCHVCPFFEEDAGPRLYCAKGYTVTLYDVERDQPFMLRVRGTAVNAFKHAFVGAVAMGRTVPWARAYTMSSKLKSGDGRSWFVPVLDPQKGHDASELKFWADIAAGYGTHQEREPAHDDGMIDDLPFTD